MTPKRKRQRCWVSAKPKAAVVTGRTPLRGRRRRGLPRHHRLDVVEVLASILRRQLQLCQRRCGLDRGSHDAAPRPGVRVVGRGRPDRPHRVSRCFVGPSA